MIDYLCIMNSIYLYYKLNITPSDSNINIIKNSINLHDLANTPSILKNTKPPNKNEYYPESNLDFINTCYIKYSHLFDNKNYQVEIIFVEILDIELLTPSLIFSEEYRIVQGFFFKHIAIENNLNNEWNTCFKLELENIINQISIVDFYKIKPISSENKLRTKLFNYQIHNINWMLDIESNLPRYDITNHKKYYFPDGRIFNYYLQTFEENVSTIQIRGGIIMDDVGVGKTLQMITLCLETPHIKTCIIVPDHLVTHWKSQIELHSTVKINSVEIISFSAFQCSYEYDRIIIDEIHILYMNNTYAKLWKELIHYNCQYKWGLSATPFPVDYSILNLLQFLSCQELTYKTAERFVRFYPLYYKIFRKNTLASISNEIQLPDMFISNNFINFNSIEKIIYDGEMTAKNSTNQLTLREICCDVILKFSSDNKPLTFDEFNRYVIQDFKDKYDVEVTKQESYKSQVDKCLNKLETLCENNPNEFLHIINNFSHYISNNPKINEHINNLKHFKNLFDEQTKVKNNRLSSYNFIKSQMESVSDCPICFESLENSVISVTSCSHIFCHPCLQSWLDAGYRNCPNCKQSICSDNIHKVTNIETFNVNYSSKITKLIEICKNMNQQVIVFTQFDKLISKISHILNIEHISNIVYNNNNLNELKNHQVVILSSNRNAAGLDLSFISNIIIFEPLIGTYSFLRDVEKQIIGRIHRINQKNNVNVIRFIISDTIEEEIYSKM